MTDDNRPVNHTCKTRLTVTFIMVAHFVCCIFTGFIIYTAWPGSSLFSWHPTLMTIAFCLLMVEAILFFSPESSLLWKVARQTKTKYHWIVQLIALFCAFLGIAAIYINKIRMNKPHFTTWHSIAGISAFGYCLMQATGGTFLLYPKLAKWLTLRQLKMYHATSGLFAFMLVGVTLVLAMFSSWFTSAVTGTSWYACVFCPGILGLIIMHQVTRAYLPQGIGVKM